MIQETIFNGGKQNMKKIAILGSTGSIGTQTVDILPSIEAEVVALTTNRRIGLLEEQARAAGCRQWRLIDGGEGR